MDLWAEFHATSWGREFVAGGFGGIVGIVSGHPLDIVRIRQQVLNTGGHGSSSAFTILRNALAKEGPASLYRGMGAPLASVTFQNAMGVALGGVGTGVLQSLIISPIELVKIRLQLRRNEKHLIEQPHK
ncbi:hypothetical protein S83_056401, partial [Arachis hypogaea]